jgi:prevent-host-death family protein
MIATQHTQSLSAFRKTAAQTIARVNQTGDAEIITVNGEARAVLISPALYDELAGEADLSRDVAVIQQSMREIAEGRGIEVNAAFAEIRKKLLARKAAKKHAPT